MNKKRFLVIVVIVAAAMLFLSPSCMTLANHLPIITSLEAPERVLPSGSCQIVCNASDPDGNELSYKWSVSGGNISGTGASVNWTAPDSEGFYDVTVWVTDGRGVEVMKQLTVEVRVNTAPKINSLIADADWIFPSDSLQVTCNASDPDGDELSYEWSTTGGNISGTGSEVIWTAPEEIGMYDITVVVDDGHDGKDTRSVTLNVTLGTPPIIEDLIVTAKDPKYLKETTTGYMVGKTVEYNIECIASDTDGELGELVYEWSCDGGEISEISGDGSMITWTAPNTDGDVTVTVIVSDIAGNMASMYISLDVVACSSCTFGS